MSDIVVKGIKPAQQRRFNALAKRVGNADRAARLALRAGLVVLEGMPANEVEHELELREKVIDLREQERAKANAQPESVSPAAESPSPEEPAAAPPG